MANDAELQSEMKAWRHDFHAHPEVGFEEKRTAGIVAAKLRDFCLDEVAEGVGGTGVVGTLKRGTGNRSIALRAEMDALRISEQGNPTYKSTNPGLMHACGHDGHTAMLLGAAKRLAEEGGFEGTVRFIFQPAEEWGKGALAMLDDGLMTRFPFDEVYGLHNLPGLPVGRVETRPGAIMSAEDIFEITLTGVGGHASRPHSGREVLVAASALILNLQTIVSRRLSPTEIAVVSATEIITDGTRNVLPGRARILGDARSFRPEVSAAIEKSMCEIARGTADTYGLTAEFTYDRIFVPLLNDATLTDHVVAAAREVYGHANVVVTDEPFTGSEDFAQFLRYAPGNFAFIGNGEDSAPLHNSSFDFNDAALLDGARLHVEIARQRLSGRAVAAA